MLNLCMNLKASDWYILTRDSPLYSLLTLSWISILPNLLICFVSLGSTFFSVFLQAQFRETYLLRTELCHRNQTVSMELKSTLSQAYFFFAISEMLEDRYYLYFCGIKYSNLILPQEAAFQWLMYLNWYIAWFGTC